MSSAGYPADVLSGFATLVRDKVPYVWGGMGALGDDCSGAVKYVFSQAGFAFGARTSEDQALLGQNIPIAGTNDLADAEPGDVLFFDYEGLNSHEELYAGDGMAYTEAKPGTVAQLIPVDTSALDDIQRFVDAAGDPLAGISGPDAGASTGFTLTDHVYPAGSSTPAASSGTGTGLSSLLGGTSLASLALEGALLAGAVGLAVLGVYKAANPGKSITGGAASLAPLVAA